MQEESIKSKNYYNTKNGIYRKVYDMQMTVTEEEAEYGA